MWRKQSERKILEVFFSIYLEIHINKLGKDNSKDVINFYSKASIFKVISHLCLNLNQDFR